MPTGNKEQAKIALLLLSEDILKYFDLDDNKGKQKLADFVC